VTDYAAPDFTIEQVPDVDLHGGKCYNGSNHIANGPALLRAAGTLRHDGVIVMASPILSPELPQFKTCSKCGELKPRDAFGRNRKLKSGLRSWCKACERARDAANREHDRETDRAWRQANPEKSREYSRRWKTKNPEKVKEMNAANYATDLDYSRNRSKSWRERNQEYSRESHRDYMRQYRKEHPDKVRASMASIRAKRAKAPGSYTDEDIEAIRVAQDNRCYICRRKLTKYHIDHFIPLALGGSNDPGNMRLACPKCNLSKSAKHPHELGILI
jgi:5-methylcytosine-specific restriction endonuclease McrA